MNPSKFDVKQLRSYSSKHLLFQRTLPRFHDSLSISPSPSPSPPLSSPRSQPPPFVPTSQCDNNSSSHLRSAIIGGFICFLIGGTLMVFASMGAGLPVLVFSGLFFGAGTIIGLTGFLKGRLFPKKAQVSAM